METDGIAMRSLEGGLKTEAIYLNCDGRNMKGSVITEK